MKKSKGFTMVELLAVLVVLAIVTAISVPVITRSLKSGKENSYEQQLNTILDGAKTYGAKNINILPTKGNSKTITLQDLKEDGYVEDDIKNPKTKKLFADTMQIKITNNNGDIQYTIVTSTIKDQS